MRVYLIRHGEKERTKGDPSLSAIGRTQAQRTGNHLKKFHIDKILASPLRRTRETADSICGVLGISYEVSDKLKERMNWGDIRDQSFEDFLKEWIKATQQRDYVPTVGYSSREAGSRLESVIKDESDNYSGNIALITHGGIIVDFLRNVFTEEELKNASGRFFDDIEPVKECSVTEVIYENEKYTLKSLAAVDHLIIPEKNE